MDDLEQKVQSPSGGRGLRKAIGTLIVAGLGFAAGYGVGSFREANRHTVEEKLYQKEKVELIMEGYAPTPGTDHEGYLVRPEMAIDSTGKTFHYLMKKDGVDFGPVRKDGKIGYTLPERTEQEIDAKWERVKEYGNDLGKRLDETWQGAKESLGEQWSRMKEYFNGEQAADSAQAR